MRLLFEEVGLTAGLGEGYEFRFVKVPKGFGCDEFWMLEAPVTVLEWDLVIKKWDGLSLDLKMKDFPMTGVSGKDCQRFAKELGKRLGKDVRVPTEVEWCRAVGEEPVRLEEYAVFGQEEICSVKTKRSNEYGLYDMRGLVWEPVRDGRNWVWRGGSWFNYYHNASAAARIVRHPADRDFYFGCRVVIGG